MTVALSPPAMIRTRHAACRRILTVRATHQLSPHMMRILLTGEDLDGFISLSPDDHIKLFVPSATAGAEPVMRDYTPRCFDAASRTLAIDFALHGAGPATRWAQSVQPGDWVQIGGPRGSQVMRGPVPHWLLIGDESALPAIGRHIEEAAAGSRITSLVAVPGAEDQQRHVTSARLTQRWIHRPMQEAANPAPLLAALRRLDLAPDTFVWIAAEAMVTRRLRSHLLQERGHPQAWMKAAGYWLHGKANASEPFD